MPEYLHPGVYIEELRGPQPIQGVSTSTTGMVGVTRKGPTAGKPQLVTSFGEFRDLFGGYLNRPDPGDRVRWELDDHEGGQWWLFPLAVKGFFDNGGRRLYVKRVVSAQAVTSEVAVPSAAVGSAAPDDPDMFTLTAPANQQAPALLRISAAAAGNWGDDIRVRLRPARVRRIPAVHPNGGGPLAGTVRDDVDGASASATIDWPAQQPDPPQGPVIVIIGGQRYQMATLPAPANGQVTLTLPTPHPRIPHGSSVKVLRQVDQDAGNGQRRVPLARTSADAVYPAALVLIGDVRATVTTVVPPAPTGGPGAIIVTGNQLPQVFETDQIAVVEAALTVQYREHADPAAGATEEPRAVEEVYPALKLHPLANSPGSIADVINDPAGSRLIRVETIGASPPAVTWDLFPGSTAAGGWLQLANGDDQLAELRPEDFVGTDAEGRRTGIQALEDIEEVSICAVPGIWSATVQAALITLCNRLRDRFAIMDPQSGLSVQDVQAFRQRLDSPYAALYHPWLRIRDPLSGQEISLPPSGHMAGVYARVDVDRGVHKAPANEVIDQIIGFADDINEREQDVLNPIGINAMRQFPTRGLRVWGARTLSSIPEWTYINVRR